MAAEKKPLTYVFVNPSTPKAFAQQLQKILTEKLQHAYRGTGKSSGAGSA